MTPASPIVATRGSDLALEQTRRVRSALRIDTELRIVRTAGDRDRRMPLSEQTGAGFFTKDIEGQLLQGEVDLAVHSLKDLPVELAPGLVLGAHLPRDVPSDLLLVRPDAVDTARRLPVVAGSRVGASSARRQALLDLYAPDVVGAPIRGNVPTRVEKARRGDFEAILLSRAGVERLNLDTTPLEVFELDPHLWPGAPGQGTIVVEARANDPSMRTALAHLDHHETAAFTGAERQLLLAYGGGCHAPFGAYAHRDGEQTHIDVAAAPHHEDGEDPLAHPMRLRRFSAADLARAVALAQAWIQAGCGAQDDPFTDHQDKPLKIWHTAPAWC